MNHTFIKYESYLSMKPRLSRDSLADLSNAKILLLFYEHNLFWLKKTLFKYLILGLERAKIKGRNSVTPLHGILIM
jgi:hypothetical protein